uniref:Uncharacterized protein n=1 Tax=Plectus sambesii TaxID=2011161 RepID=A0A914ULG8_9BILA
MTSGVTERFIAKETASTLTLRKYHPFFVPKGTFCLPVYGFTMEELFKAGNGTTAELHQYFTGKDITRETFLNNTGPLQWPRTIMDYLTTMTLIEAGQWYGEIFSFSANYSVMDSGENSWISRFNKQMLKDYLNEDTWNAHLVLEYYLDRLNVTVEEMKQALGRELIKHFTMDSWHYAADENLTYIWTEITDFKIAFISWYYTCFDIDFPHYNFSLTGDGDYVFVQMKPKTKRKSDRSVRWVG